MKYNFKNVRIRDIDKDEFNPDGKIAKLKEIKEKSKKYYSERVLKNKNYYYYIKLYREDIIADLYNEVINNVRNN